MSGSRRIQTVALLLLLVFGLARAASLAWVCDDSFISIRYADNLLNGHGLVYNAGERVEGYTNLLWTLLLAALMYLGVTPLTAAKVPGIIAYAALALCLAHWSWRQSRDGSRPFLPLAAGLVLISNDFHVWATAGLETMLFTALAVQALVLTCFASRSTRLAWLAGGLFGLLVALISILADVLGFGASGFGAQQIAGTLLGAVILIVGLWILRRPAAARE